MPKPMGHGERYDSHTFYKVVDMDKIPDHSNCVYTVWKFGFLERLKLLLGGTLWIGLKSPKAEMRIVVAKQLGSRGQNDD